MLFMKKQLLTFLIIALSTLAALGIFRVVPTSDSTVFFEPDAPQLATLAELKRQYGSTDNAIITIVSSGESLITAEHLRQIGHLTAALQKLPHLVHTESITTAKAVQSTPFGPRLSTLIPANFESLSPERQREIVQRVTSSPLCRNYLVNDSGTAVGINLHFELDNLPAGADQEIRDSLTAIVHRELAPPLRSFITGGICINGAFTEAGLKDSLFLTPLMIAVTFLLLALFIRSKGELFALVLTVIPVPFIVMGISGWLNLPFSPSSAVVPIITGAIAVATSIHVITAFQLHLENHTRSEAMALGLQASEKAIFYTAITTAAGFFSLNFSNTPPFRTMGNLAGIGTMIVALFSLFLLPQLLVRWGNSTRTLFHWESKPLFRLVTNHPKLILSIATVLVGISSIGLPHLAASDSFVNYFDSRFTFRRDTDSTLANLTGIDYLQLSIPAPKAGVSDSIYLEKIDSLTNWCRLDSNVRYAISLPLILKESYQSLTGKWQLPPHSLRNRAIAEMEKSTDQRIIASHSSAAQLFIVFNRVTSNDLRSFAESCSTKAVQTMNNPEITVGSTSLLFARLSESNSRSMKNGMILSLILVTGILMAVTRNSKLGTVSIIPNLLPLLMSFGIWGIFVQKSGLGLSVVAPMALGIIVDDTVHFIVRYRRFKSEGYTTVDAIRLTYEELTSAVITTSIILMAGFASLTISGFQPTREMGILTAVTIFLALIADLLVLPALLVLFDSKPKK